MSTILVTSNSDSGPGSLREAIATANSSAGADRIEFDATVFTGGAASTITLASDLANISDDLDIIGTTGLGVTLDGNDLHRGFFVASGAVSIADMTIARAAAIGQAGGGSIDNGYSGSGGGGGAGLGGALFVASGATVDLSDVSILDAKVVGGAGGTGGVYADYGNDGGGFNGTPGGQGDTGAGPTSGGFGAGGGGARWIDDDAVGYGAAGGFGGGGGGGDGGAWWVNSSYRGGPGGFGGGSGATRTTSGGGGLGAGAGIFVQEGGALTIHGGSLVDGTVFGGSAGDSGASPGQAYGKGLFLHGSASTTFVAAAGETTSVDFTITDQNGSAGTSGPAGAGSIVIGDAGHTGTVVLNGTNTYTGATTVNAGTLLVDGSIKSAATVNSGGTVGGHGTLGAVAVNSGGHLAPGNSPGILTTGDFTLNAGGSLEVEIGGTAAGTQYDQVIVNGKVMLGGMLSLTLINGFALGDRQAFTFTLIDNDGTDAVDGTFAALAEGAIIDIGGESYALTYTGGTGNDVVLNLVDPTITVDTAADTVDPNDGLTSLREAIALANAGAGTGATIIFDPTVFTGGAASRITLTSDLPNIFVDLDIIGTGGPGVTLDGDDLHRGFFVASGVVSIKDMTIAHAAAIGADGAGGLYSGGGGGGGAGLGGALFVASDATVDLSNVSILDTKAVGGAGGQGGGYDGTGTGTGNGGGFNGTPGGLGAISGADATSGGFGAGGGGSWRVGAAGGFGGGGGGGDYYYGGGGPGGFGGGNGTGSSFGEGGGGGGLGAGAGIFVQQGGTLTIHGGSLVDGTVEGGAGGSQWNGAGQGYGKGLFLQGDASTLFVAAANETTSVDFTITDQNGSAGTSGPAGSGSIVVGDAGHIGTVVLNGAHTYTGTTTVNAGTLLVDGSIHSATTVNSGGTLRVDGSINATATVNSGGTILVDGAINGSTTVNSGGTLLVDGAIIAIVTVNSGGTVGGHGTIGALFVNSGGHLAPGNSPGILTTGEFALNAGSSLDVELGGTVAGTQYDQVIVYGTVTLGGALSLTLINGFAPGNGKAFTFTLIDNDGTDAVNGTFAGLAEGASVDIDGKSYALTYAGGTGNDVALNLIDPTITVDTTADTIDPNDGRISLRESIALANVGTGDGATINFDPTVFTGGAASTITLTSDLPNILVDLDIIGTTGLGVTLDGGNLHRGFFVASGVVSIADMTIAHAAAIGVNSGGGGGGAGLGGALFVASGATVDLRDVSIRDAMAIGGSGAGTSVHAGGGFNGTPGGQAEVWKGAGASSGGFGAGGGAGGLYDGAAGGFGGGGGGAAWYSAGGAGGFGAGNGTSGNGGGGGLGAGAGIFLQEGGTLTVHGGSLVDGAVAGGDGGNPGQGYGKGLFLHGSASTTFVAGAGETTTVDFSIIDQNGSAGTSDPAGSGSIVIGATGHSGTIVLSGTSTYTGATTINAGTLMLAAGGSIASSATTVNGASTLAGNGTAGAVDIASGGTLSPGASAGTLATGDLSFAAGASFKVELGGAGAWDRVHVTGTVSLGGATLDASLIDAFDPEAAPGAAFTIIDNDLDDAVSGSFSGLAEGATFLLGGSRFSITYAGGTDNNDVVLIATNDAPDVSAATTLAAIGEDFGPRLITQAELLTHAIDLDGPPLEAVGLTISSGLGSLADNRNGTWSYTPAANDDTAVTFSYQVTDGTTPVATSATLDITPVNDPPQSGAVVLSAIAEDSGARVITQAQLLSGMTDPDGPPAVARDLAIASGLGSLANNGNGTWTYTPGANDATAVSFSYVIDDGNAVAGSASLDITPVNDAPVTPGVTLASIAANDSGRVITQAELLANASDVDSHDLSAINLAIATGLGTLASNGNGTWTYTPASGDSSEVTFSYQVTDGSASVAASAKLDITEPQQAPGIPTTVGTPASDSFTAPAEDHRFIGLGDIDTITFGFKLTDATVSYQGNEIVIDSATSHTVLNGVERFVFADGTVDNSDSEPLVDDLFYYSHNHDVWNAQVDAEAHYHQSGWKEGRDPNAFFSTSFYLAVNADVMAAGIDPLAHFHQSGWAEGRQPSMAFDAAAYLAAYPDVATAEVDSLAHFLQSGAAEGRQPFALASLIAPDGFDFVYYLQHNPDVAAAHVDPYQHFQTVGWQEGRNPNALFDVNGYIARYDDVDAADVNPLDHYNAFGWHEGRDPSVDFDTTAYLAANPDVAAAGDNPLVHFLRFGISEGRPALGDGLWG